MSNEEMTEEKFQSEVAKLIKAYPLVKLKKNAPKLCRKLYKQGYSVKDAAGIIILNS